MRIDVFTLVPHAYAWLTEQVPVANVLGTELELRLFNYRDTTPLRAGQVDDEPYGGGAGMVLRVDVVAAALDAAYAGTRTGPRDRAHAERAPADAGDRRGARRRSRPSRSSPRGSKASTSASSPARDRRDLRRPVRPLERRPARDARPRRRSETATRRARRGLRGVRELLRGARRQASSTRTTHGPPSSGAGACRMYSSPAITRGSRRGAESTW